MRFPRLTPGAALLAASLAGCMEPIVLGRLNGDAEPPRDGRTDGEVDAGDAATGPDAEADANTDAEVDADAAPDAETDADAGPPEPCRQPAIDIQVGDGPTCGDAPGFAFRSGICSCSDVVGNAPLTLEAFDSCDRSDPIAAGDLGVNGPLDAFDLQVGGSVTVAGARGIRLLTGADLFIGDALESGGELAGEADVLVSGDAAIAGDIQLETLRVGGTLRQPDGRMLSTSQETPPAVTPDDVEVAPPCRCDTGPDLTAQIARIAADNDDQAAGIDPDGFDTLEGPVELELEAGRYYLTRLLATAPVHVRARGQVVLAVEGDVASESGGPIVFEIADEDSSLDLLVGGALTLSDTLDVGSPDHAGLAHLYVGTVGTVELSARTDIAGVLHAPLAEVVSNAELTVRGALVARRFTYGAPVHVYYDQALAPVCE